MADMIKSTNLTSDSSALGRIINKTAIETFDKNTYFFKLANTYRLPKGQNKFAMPIIDDITLVNGTTAITEGVVPNKSGMTINMVDFTMAEYGDYVQFSNVSLTDSPISLIQAASAELGKKMAYAVDTVAQNKILTTVDGTGTNIVYGGDATSKAEIVAADIATSAHFAYITAKLKGVGAKYYDGNSYVAVAHPHVIKDLLTETGNVGFFEASKYSQPENLFNGEIGKIFGVRFIESANVNILADAGATTTDVYPTYVMGKDAYGITISENMSFTFKPLGSSGAADPLNQIATLGVYTRFGVEMLKENALWVLYTASSVGNNAA